VHQLKKTKSNLLAPANTKDQTALRSECPKQVEQVIFCSGLDGRTKVFLKSVEGNTLGET
jgi:hypothetical protein